MKLTWDQIGERLYETGVDRGVLYPRDDAGHYNNGFAWNGLTAVTESPSGAEVTPQYADNIMYLNLVSTEWFGATIEAFTYPDEFAQCDGTASPENGIKIGQQTRKRFGLAYRTQVGNDIDGPDFGYKIHLIYGALATPSEKAYATINDSPEALAFSWDLTTEKVDVPGFKPTASLTVDSTKVDATALAALEDILYGTAGVDPRMPAPLDVVALFNGTVTVVVPPMPTFDSGTHTITIPTVAGVEYLVDGVVVAPGALVITADTIVTAEPTTGYTFPAVTDNDWFYDFV